MEKTTTTKTTTVPCYLPTNSRIFDSNVFPFRGVGFKRFTLAVTTIFFFPASSHISVSRAHGILSMPSYDDIHQVSAKRPLRLKAEVVNALALKSVGISKYAEYMTNALLLTT